MISLRRHVLFLLKCNMNNFKQAEKEEGRSLPVSVHSSFKYKSNKEYYLYHIILFNIEIRAKLLRIRQMSVIGNKYLMIVVHRFLKRLFQESVVQLDSYLFM